MRTNPLVSLVRAWFDSRTRRTKQTQLKAGSISPTVRPTQCVSPRSGTVASGRQNGNVFQVLPDTIGLGPEVWRVLSKCHDMRNRTHNEGALDVDDRLVSDLSGACRKVAEKVTRLPPIPEKSK